MIIWIVIVVIALIFLWYLASPLFVNKEVNEGFPIENQNNNQANQETNNEHDTVSPSYQGDFMGANAAHQVSGQALVLEDSGERYLRFENFEATNGPDLKVYLSTDTSADDYVSLGDLKGNIGNQNYVVPEDVDLQKYDNVLIWCEAFSVLFGHAELG